MESDYPEKRYYTLAFGTKLVINPLRRQVHLKGKLIQLTQKEFDLLYLMPSHPGQMFTREQIYNHI
ncbi:MAG: winged helix-turn-helix transcriptional regulator [Clostridiales bacterium]|nr:winged helix-turn-helix transcriptional regulator [Clostridiales bacterium]